MIKTALRTTLLAAATLAASVAPAHAAWPDRPISLVVPFAPGGSTDSTARMLAERLRDVLGQPVIIENKAGSGGNIGAAYVARAKPDGYTFLLATSTLATNATLFKNLPLDIRKDLLPVAGVALIPNVLLVNKDNPAQTLPEFVDYARKNGAKLNYGSAGNGSSQHLSGALFNHLIKGEMVHVPYSGGAPANTDLLAGQIQLVFSPLVEVLPFIDSGRLRALGITTKERSARLPNVPAINEVLPGYEIALWNGVFAPTGTPAAIVEKMNAAVGSVLADPAFVKVFAEQGSKPFAQSPAEFQAFMTAEIDKWGGLVRMSGSQVD